MAGKVIILTGATSSVGSATLERLLATGRTVNAVIRSASKYQPLLLEKYKDYIRSGKLLMTEIPDMCVPHAFDRIAKNAEAIMHIATPLAYSDLLKTVIEPAWTILKSILDAAASSGSVKRVIVTGSLASIIKIPDDLMKGQVVSEMSWNSITLQESLNDPSMAYQYSKVDSERKAWAYMGQEEPDFDLIVLLVPSVIGRSAQVGFKPQKDKIGGEPRVYRELFDRDTPGFLFPYFMNVDDIAEVHEKSLSLSVPGNERYLFHAPEFLNASAIATKTRKAYPQLKDRIPLGGENIDLPPDFFSTDRSKFNKVFGAQWKTGWESVKETVDDILDYEKSQMEGPFKE